MTVTLSLNKHINITHRVSHAKGLYIEAPVWRRGQLCETGRQAKWKNGLRMQEGQTEKRDISRISEDDPGEREGKHSAWKGEWWWWWWC